MHSFHIDFRPNLDCETPCAKSYEHPIYSREGYYKLLHECITTLSGEHHATTTL